MEKDRKIKNQICIGVYGSLRQGMYNHRPEMLGKQICKAKALGRLICWPMACFPHLLKANKTHQSVVLEIYSISIEHFHVLNRMEAECSYIPILTWAMCEPVPGYIPGKSAWVWYWFPKYTHSLLGSIEVPNGDWVEYAKKNKISRAFRDANVAFRG